MEACHCFNQICQIIASGHILHHLIFLRENISSWDTVPFRTFCEEANRTLYLCAKARGRVLRLQLREQAGPRPRPQHQPHLGGQGTLLK